MTIVLFSDIHGNIEDAPGRSDELAEGAHSRAPFAEWQARPLGPAFVPCRRETFAGLWSQALAASSKTPALLPTGGQREKIPPAFRPSFRRIFLPLAAVACRQDRNQFFFFSGVF